MTNQAALPVTARISRSFQTPRNLPLSWRILLELFLELLGGFFSKNSASFRHSRSSFTWPHRGADGTAPSKEGFLRDTLRKAFEASKANTSSSSQKVVELPPQKAFGLV
jgi:hypothetical protein